jgi:anti-anti-sigma factor
MSTGLLKKGAAMLGEVSVRPNATVARPHGDLDLVNVDALRELLDGLCAGPATTIIIDLSDVSFMDVLSLSVILGAADALRESGRQLVVEGANNSVRRMCALFNADDIFDPPETLPYIVIPPAC